MAINSVQLKKGSTTKTVEVGSKAYNTYLSQGYTVVAGTEKNAPKTTSTKTTSSSSSSSSTKTTTPTETVDETVARAKALLGTAYDPNTAAPTAARLDEIASQDFVTPENKAAYETTKLNPVNQDYMAASYTAALPKTTVPTSAGDITSPYQSYVTPTSVTQGFGDISFATAGTTGLQAQMQSQMEEYYRKQREQQEAYNTQEKGRLQTFMDSLTSPKDARDQAQEETGIDVAQHFSEQEKGFKEIESLTNQYNKLIEAKDSQIAATQDKMASMNFINNQTAQIERNAAPQLTRLSADINAKAAVMQALQGNFAEAQKYINQAVADATSMNKYEFDIYKANYDINRDNFDRLGDIYTSAYEAKMTLLGAQYTQQLSEKESIGELLLEYPSSGIDIYNDTWEQAVLKAGKAAAAKGDGKTASTFSTETVRNANMVLNGQASLNDFTQATQADIRGYIWNMPVTADFIETYKQDYINSMKSGASTSMDALNKAAQAAASAAWDNHRMSIVGPNMGTQEEQIPSGKEPLSVEGKEERLQELGMSSDEVSTLLNLVNEGWDSAQLISVWKVPAPYVWELQ